MKTVIVSRHPATIEWLKKKGVEGEVIPHVSNPEQIKNCRVVGNLPLHLAAVTDCVGAVEIPYLPPDKRGGDLTIEEMEEYGVRIRWYKITEIQPPSL